MARRHHQVEEEVAHLAGEFLARESHVKALLTVTHAEMSDNYKYAKIFLSVLPSTMEQEALRAAKRLRSDLHDYLRKHSALHPTPTVDFELDWGEKNRQRVDELTRK
jgi:ribosome-binding factor A